MGSVIQEEAPERLVRGMPAYPVPMVLVARLAVTRGELGVELGTRPFPDARRTAVSAGGAAAGRRVDERASSGTAIEPYVSNCQDLGIEDFHRVPPW